MMSVPPVTGPHTQLPSQPRTLALAPAQHTPDLGLAPVLSRIYQHTNLLINGLFKM